MHSRATQCKHAFILAILCKSGKGSHVYICARSPAHSHRAWAESIANAWLPYRNYGAHLMPSCTTKPHTICTVFLSIFNPRHMRREGYGSRCVCLCVCVCVCVCYHASCYIPLLYVEIKVPLGFIWHFQDMHCVAFVENALFKSFGDIC